MTSDPFASRQKSATNVILECSPYLTTLLNEWPSIPADLANQSPENMLAALCAEATEAAQLSNRDEAKRHLRLAKQKLALLVALCDLSGQWKLAEVTRALTNFADASLNAALSFLWRQEIGKSLKPEATSVIGYTILAMGKMGAHELNYSSDIDVIVLYDSLAAPLKEGVEPALFFVRLTRDLVNLMQDVTADGYVFRTDLRLRPDPRATQVAIDIEAAATYYEYQGQNWERAAMIKARPCAGDIALGQEFLKRLQPYIWRKYLDFAAIADIQSMKRQIHSAKGHGEIAVRGHNLKLGRGGIREIEFFVQTQQLIAGGRNTALRCIGTVEGLGLLAREKWITPQTATELTHCYERLRTWEHRAQMMADQQTHETPSDDETFQRYALFCGYADVAAFEANLRATLECVQNHYSALFESADDLSAGTGNLVFTGGEDDPATLETLRRMGYEQVSEISATIRAWHFGRYRATRTARARELLTELMPMLLKALASSGEADRAFIAFDKFLESLSSGVQLLSLFKANPRILDLMAQILGSAPRLTEKISAQPRMLEAVVAPDFFGPLPSKAALQTEINAQIADDQPLEEAMDLARVFAREKNFRVSARILSETVSAEEAGQGFSDVADVILAKLLAVIQRDIARRHGQVPGGAAVILGLGKLGGHEMTAGSDLDLMLLYTNDESAEQSDGTSPLTIAQYYARITQSLVNALKAPTAEGVIYDVDMRLRPSGSKGPLAVGLSSFTQYQKAEAWTWERMAMTRARVIAGDAALAQSVQHVLRASLSEPRDADTIRADIAKMRGLMLREHHSEGVWDLKRAAGGQVEIEFIAQGLELIHAHKNPGILNPNTEASLTSTAKANLINASNAETLSKALGLYQRLTHILRLCVTGAFDPATTPRHLLQRLAQAAGQPDIAATEALLADTQEKVAALFRQMFRMAEG